MDNKHEILNLLRAVADGRTPPEDALLELKTQPFADLGYAKVDLHRGVRQGAAEVIYGAGKSPEQIRGIAAAMGERGCRNILVTRVDREAAEFVGASLPLDYTPLPAWGSPFPGSVPPLGILWWPPAAPATWPWRRRLP